MELYNFSCQADPELEAIRQRRMQELMAQCGGANQQNAGQQKAQEDAKQYGLFLHLCSPECYSSSSSYVLLTWGTLN